ncbi:LOW QUALITY PROTEIN: separase-like [Actinidia eriantha]|uniref:LOW QUALITY PROTEIN: separase-like n=1 Tax=Actinidia eriantha TaxID=165200 RepID=UPI0025884C89|nr:LOW QUALITY PROTEIN: separase-like [Actinidia eriantha]
MDSDAEYSLINKLQSSDIHQIYQLFFDYLHPFTDLIPLTTATKPKKSKKSSNTAEEDSHRSTVRSLAKKFLPFLNRSLSLIPKRLSETPNFDEKIGFQLFRTYQLCLNCLECVSSQLSCKPYSVQIQRVRLIHCFEAWSRYRDAQDEGFSTLESLGGIEIGGKGSKAVKKGKYVPGLGKECVDSDFALLVVEIVVTLVKCVAMRQSKEEEDYRRVMVLVDEVTPWFRVLDASTYEKLHRALVTYLNKCTLFLVGELMNFKTDLMRGFCSATFSENSKSVMKDQLQKFARRICSSLFSQQGEESSSIMGILTCILDYMASECKVEMERTTTELLEFICYCANKCRTASRILCSSLAAYLSKLSESCQVSSPFDLILRLYVTGLFISDCYGQSRQDNSISTRKMHDGCAMAFLLDKEDVLHNLSVLLSGLKCHCKDISLPIGAEYNSSVDFACQTYPHIKSNYEGCRVCKMKNRKSYMLSYCNALKFLCQPLADFVNSARKEIVAEIEGVSFPTKLCNIQDAFHQFCDVFIFCRSAFEQDSNAFDDYEKSVVSVAVAALTLSFRTRRYIKESVNFTKQVISVDWIQASGLKFLFAALHNVGVTLYRNKKVKEASKALNLCCRASWTCVSYLCEAFSNRTNRFCSDDVSQDAVTNFVSDACAKSAFLLDVLYQCDSHNKLPRTMEYSLQNWSAAENVFNRLPSPIALVKQWVKIECKLFKHQNTKCSGTTLYSLVSSSAKVSKRSLGIILEQELLAYNELSTLNPRLCQKMQMDIIGLLLSEVYITHDSFLQKSKILVAKGRELRACGMEGLNGCIECLSEAISTINDMNGETVQQSITVRHQLALSYSLRALCIQEAEPNSKKPFQDIRAALNLWLSLDCSLADDQCDMVCENMLIVLYHLVDMLSIKGCTEFQRDLYELLIRLFKRNNVPLEKCLALLWQYRRLGHALCASPVSDRFIATLSKHCDKFKSIDFWISCMNGSLPLEVGFQQCFSFMFSSIFCGSSRIKGSFRPDIKVDEVKQAASDLISCVPPCSGSVFLAAHLYHDLCGKLISNGQLIEALAYAKEAHRLRSKLLQEKFRYSVEQQGKICDENGENIHKSFYNLSTFQMYSSVATAVWSRDNILCDLEGCILTPWSILQCYLESTLQVGIIHELTGNGSEAETLLLWGKDISTFQGLPIFKLAFSSVLGILYRKKRLWDLAEKELQYAKQMLADCCTTISCLKCRLLFEVTIDLHLGDLFRSRLDGDLGKLSVKSLCNAETLYKSALKKLNLSEWRNSVSNREEISVEKTIVCDALASEVGICASSLSACATYQSDIINEVPSKVDVLETRIEAKKSRKAKKSIKVFAAGTMLDGGEYSRMTRSRYRSQRNSENIPCEVHVGLPKYSNNEQCVAFPNFLGQRGPVSEIKSSAGDLRCEVASVCNNMKCWNCLPIEVMESGCINNFVQMIWEFARRRLLLRLLASIGKCVGARGEIHEAREILLQSISVLVSRNLSVPHITLLDLIGKDIPGDPLAVERAAILYSLCWFTLKSYPLKGTRINCCDMDNIQISRIISWLMLAFILCREVPHLVQKVSRLLAAIFVLSASTEIFSPYLSPCKELSESHWASYFHQASLGTHLNHKLLSSLIGKQKVQDSMDVKGSCLTGLSSIASEMRDLLRLAPELLQDLEGYMLRFFQGLPCTTIVCISMLGGDFASLLTELLDYRSCAHAWILLSRFNSNSQPVVILVPVESVLEEGTEDDTNSGSGILFEDKSHVKHWHCPWGATVVDQVAPDFRMILKENYLSSSMHPLEDTKMNRSIWWMQRKNLDQRLSNFLRDLEDSWFGPWKYLLLGELSGSKHQELVQRKLMHNLKVKCKVDAHESLLKVVVGGAKHSCEREECVLQLILSKGCFIGGVGNCSQKMQGTLADTCDGDESLSKIALNLILEASQEAEEEQCLNREPVILVLDFDVQMLPWENLPVLRKQEVYRMPSISSISVTLDRYCRLQEQVGMNSAIFPLIDPLDAFYLLNPSGDLSSTQVEFEDYFREKNLEGKAGTAATIEELAVALRSHDLFLYFGHGSGAQYIPEHEIQKLENCAATLLMGCSSGSLSLNGCYTPQGAPLSYLLAGSPVIIANLWEVTDKDIDRFGKAMLDCCLKERLTASTGCVQCNVVAEKFKSMQITGTKGIAKKKTSRKKFPEDVDIGTPTECCNHRPKIGSFMGQAREACTLPFLIGASPVCYGVPTGISKKKEL